MSNEKLQSVDKMLHQLWTKAVGTDNYDKSQWIAFEKAVREARPAKPYGYAVEANDGHIAFFKDDPKGFRSQDWEGLMTVRDLFTATQVAKPDTLTDMKIYKAVDEITRPPLHRKYQTLCDKVPSEEVMDFAVDLVQHLGVTPAPQSPSDAQEKLQKVVELFTDYERLMDERNGAGAMLRYIELSGYIAAMSISAQGDKS